MTITFDGAKITEENGYKWLCLKVADENAARRMVYELPKDKLHDADIRPHKEKRSIDANAYCWVLIDKLAEATHIPKTDIYRNAIKEIGGVSEFVCVPKEAADKMRRIWESRGLGWQAEEVPCKLPKCAKLVMYYGSSVYDRAQMSRLVDLIVQECKQQGIETLTPAELQELKDRWQDAR